jgi:hypothetical protein
MFKNKKSNIEKFEDFMTKHKYRRNHNKEITHVSHKSLHGDDIFINKTFSIPDESYDEFLKLYQKVLDDNHNVHIHEHPKNVCILVIDVDFRFGISHSERQYLNKHIEVIVKKFNEKFIKFLKVDIDLVKAFIFEKSFPTYNENKKEYKDTFHIIYPFLPMNIEKRNFFFDLVKKEIIKENSFSDIPYICQHIDVLDKHVIKYGCFMYGSHKINREPYLLTKIYDKDVKICDVDEHNKYDMVTCLSYRKHTDEDDIDFIY